MGAAPRLPEPKSEPPALETVGEGKSRALLDAARGVVLGARGLLEFVDAHRDAARQAGIETLAIEMSSILEGERLERVLDALERASEKSRPAQLSGDGLQLLHRIERLLAEAGSNIRRFSSRHLGAASPGPSPSGTMARGAARLDFEGRRLELAAARGAPEREAALVELERRRLHLLRGDDGRAADPNAGTRRALLDSMRSLFPSAGGLSGDPAWGPPPDAPVLVRGEKTEDGLGIGWAIVIFGALTLGASVIFALTMSAYRAPDPPKPKPRH